MAFLTPSRRMSRQNLKTGHNRAAHMTHTPSTSPFIASKHLIRWMLHNPKLIQENLLIIESQVPKYFASSDRFPFNRCTYF